MTISVTVTPAENGYRVSFSPTEAWIAPSLDSALYVARRLLLGQGWGESLTARFRADMSDDPNELRRLAEDPDPVVQDGVARNPNSNLATLAALALKNPIATRRLADRL